MSRPDHAREVRNLLSDPAVANRFWSKVDRDGPVPEHCPDVGNCWIWNASKSRRGYGSFHAGPRRGIGRSLKANRVSWMLAGGELAKGQCVCHRCDNPSCVRPDHLFAGSQLDNIQDMKRKRRARSRDQRGELHSLTSLTDDIVLEARKRVRDGETVAAVARSLGIQKGTLWNAVRGNHWAHLPGAVPNLEDKYRNTSKGSAHGCHKLTESDVAAIRARKAKGELQRSIAADMGVSETLVSAIVRRVIWRHVP